MRCRGEREKRERESVRRNRRQITGKGNDGAIECKEEKDSEKGGEKVFNDIEIMFEKKLTRLKCTPACIMIASLQD